MRIQYLKLSGAWESLEESIANALPMFGDRSVRMLVISIAGPMGTARFRDSPKRGAHAVLDTRETRASISAR